MSKFLKWLLVILALLVAAAAIMAGLTYYLYKLPFQQAENTMPTDQPITLSQNENGTLLLTWPEGVNADYYVVLITQDTGAEQPKVLYSNNVEGVCYCTIPALPEGEKVTFCIASVARYELPDETRTRLGEQNLEVTTVYQPPKVEDLEWTADPETGTVEIRFGLAANETARLYVAGQDVIGKPSRVLTEGNAVITFGDGGDYPMLSHGEVKQFTFDVIREEKDLIFQGYLYGRVTVVREDLLGTVLQLNCTDEGNNVYTLSWNETKGEHYELQVMDTKQDTWVTIHTVDRTGTRSYTTPHLDRFRDYSFRVIAMGGQTLPDSDMAATPAEAKVTTGVTAVYSTIWPLQDLDVYNDRYKTQVLTQVEGGTAFCVLDVKNDMFKIRYDGENYGWIDSNYCMINLPEYIGDLCLYDITNSYSSKYMVHEYEIPEVTNTVVKGYEKVQMADTQQLVPLLYPAAVKLVNAAFAARELGYTLKIYDSFRPQSATRSIYSLTQTILENQIPEQTFTGKVLEDLPELEEGQTLTYYKLMTDSGRYSLGNFLANGTSNHNKGTALDLTLVKNSNGKEVEMQTSIHDLSWYSEVKQNNDNAKTLRTIMTGAGFGTLSSEWWHFQDNDALKGLSLKALWSGVTPKCWMADDNGWRYRRENGNYYKNTTKTIDGVTYTFDENGYVVTQE